MSDPIAIIGISGIYPQATGLDQFYRNLASGIDSVQEVSAARKKDVGLPPDAKCQLAAMLEHVDQFDHEFFQLSRKEAEYMDPHQRILLQLACAAIENGGYGLNRLRRTRTGVFVAASGGGYRRLLQGFEPVGLIGNLPAALAGRIAYTLDLHGPAMVIDTACSSSLVAVIEGCRQLRSKEIDFALAGAVNIFFLEDQIDNAKIEIIAPDGRSKTFDARANGSGWGEGGGVVLLRTLDKALEHGDPIHAIIRGGAVNQDGARSNGLAAPSPDAQCEVILEAWRDAGIDPERLSYIEAHGTGTKLGDPIEIEGITRAFQQFTSKSKICAIGSVKTNIGHLVGAAGIAGLTKLVLSLEHSQIPPSLHYRSPNPFINFGDCPVFVNAGLRPWDCSENPSRLAGVSSFGLSGTNAHLIVEEASRRVADRNAVSDQGPTLIKLSAKTPKALHRYVQEVAAFFRSTNESLTDIAYTLAWGRDDYACRYATVVKSRNDAALTLEQAQLEPDSDRDHATGDVKTVLLLSGDAEATPDLLRVLKRFKSFEDAVRECGGDGIYTGGVGVNRFAFLYGMYQLWASLGIHCASVIGSGEGNLVSKVISGKLPLDQALLQMQSVRESGFNVEKLKAAIADLSKKGRVIFLEAGQSSSLSRFIRELQGEKSPLSSLTVSDDVVLSTTAELYGHGAVIDWEKFYGNHSLRRVAVPTYPFEPTRCWVVPQPQDAVANEKKIDPAHVSTDEEYGVLAEPGTATQKAVAKIWGEILKRDTLKLSDDYFEIGGNSLEGMQALNRIEKQFGIKLDFEEIYEFSTVAALAQEVDDRRRAAAATDAVRSSEESRPLEPAVLSSGQERLWFLDQLAPATAFYNLAFCFEISGSLEVSILERSLTKIAARHQALRTVFPQKRGVPVQQVLPAEKVQVRVVDLTSELEEVTREKSAQIAADESRRPFDLGRGPLWRVILIRRSATKSQLLFAMHHIISDAWSMGLLIRELSTFYTADLQGRPSTLPELPIQYLDYARAQRNSVESEAVKRDVDYWCETLASAATNLDLPYDYSRPLQRNGQSRRCTFHLPSVTTARLDEICARERTTRFMVLLAAFNGLLARYSGQEEICVGTPVAGRNSSEAEQLIGFFVNTLVIRADLSGNPSFHELLRRTRSTVSAAFSHQSAPFDEVVKRLHLARDLDRNALFQVLFMLQNIEMSAPQVPGLEWKVVELESGVSQFDLVVSLLETSAGLVATVEYGTDVFKHATAERMLEHFGTFLESVMSDPEMPIGEVPLLSRTELRLLLRDWQGENAAGTSPANLSQLIAEQAARTPDAIALIEGAICCTYRELNERANQIACYLSKEGGGPEQVIGIAMGRSIELVLGLLAILKCGAAYLPLDTDYPAERLKHMLADARAKLVLVREVEREYLDSAGVLEGIKAINIDRDDGQILCESRVEPEQFVNGGNLAYIIYTSGSSGLPKGVMVNHSSLSNFVLAMASRMRVGPSDRVLEFASPSFDASAVQLYPALVAGAAVVLHPSPNRLSNQELLKLCREQKITVLDLPGGFWRQWIQDIAAHHEHTHAGLHTFMTGGESVPWSTLNTWKQVAAPGSRFLSSYGLTETTVTTTLYDDSEQVPQESEKQSENIPLGMPLSNTRVYVLDKNLQLLPAGCIGELYIGGAGVARGYAQAPDGTAARFIPDPFNAQTGSRMYRTGDLVRRLADGSLQFVTRSDEQVKVRGFRIETKEIESVLRRCPGVLEAAVIAKKDAITNTRLVAYIANGNGTSRLENIEEIRLSMRSKLPEYMIPAQFVFLDTLPLTANAKIDRDALPEPLHELGSNLTEQRTPLEQRLAELWCEILNLPRVWMEQNFFEIGGHSLLATQLISRISDAFNVDLPLRAVFEFPTIAAFAKQIETAPQKVTQRIPVVSRTGPLPLSFSQQRLWFLEQLEPSRGRFNVLNAVLLKGKLNVCALERSLQGLVLRHESLRTVFPALNGQPTQAVLAFIPTPVSVLDLQNLPEVEKQHICERTMAQEAHFPFDLSRGPLFRSQLLQLKEEEFLLLLSLHHIVFDGWYFSVLMEDLMAQYREYCAGREPNLPDMRIQYADYAAWQRQRLQGETLEGLLNYWTTSLANAPAKLILPQDSVSTSGDNAGRYCFSIPALLAEKLEKLSHEESTTLFVVMLSALSGLLYSYSGQEDMVIGIDIANRSHIDTERLIGCFFNHLALRLDLSGNPTVQQIVARTRETVLKAFAHQELPFDLLVQNLRPSRSGNAPPLFQVLLVYQNAPVKEIEIPDLTLTPLETETGPAKLDLTLFLKPEKDELAGVVEYDRGVFFPKTIEQMMQRYTWLLELMVAEPGRQLGSILPPDERSTALFAFNESLN
ncbi:MAG: amino acid adenylation domain-containing protein [Actinomycetota bacterium]